MLSFRILFRRIFSQTDDTFSRICVFAFACYQIEYWFELQHICWFYANTLRTEYATKCIRETKTRNFFCFIFYMQFNDVLIDTSTYFLFPLFIEQQEMKARSKKTEYLNFMDFWTTNGSIRLNTGNENRRCCDDCLVTLTINSLINLTHWFVKIQFSWFTQ